MIRRLIAGLALGLAAPAFAAPSIAGRWLTADGGAVVAIGACGAKTCGRVVKVLKAPADKADAARQAIGTTVLTDLVPNGDGWKGRLYNPKTGKTYDARVTRKGGKLKVEGCVAVFCQTIIWTATR